MNPADALRSATSFLTIWGRGTAPTPGALGWFPVVGAAIGASVGAVWWGAAELWSPLLAALLAVGADLVVTGALHHDGLADSADGLLPHLDRDRRLEVMRQPDVGAFGVTTLIVVVGLRVGALASLAPSLPLVAGVWCGSRTAMAVVARTLPYARSQGLASSFLGGRALPVLVAGAALSLALLIWSGPQGVAALLSLTVASGAVAGVARRRLGGFTGDVLGAVGVLGETAALVTLAARW